ncbi:hypothetical protein Q666_14940 [Marinobacter sp. ES-1]|nr:hypothetical protein Q666_14940 [Marinobacter sp. ES-1]
MELLLVYAWWCSLCVWEKGEVFATESTEEHGKKRLTDFFATKSTKKHERKR